jgi:hypothetical protein
MFARERLAWPSSGLPCRRRGRSATRGSTCSAAREHHGPGRSTAARHARQPHARPCSPRAGASSARSRAGAGASGSRRRNQRRRRVPLSLLRFAELAQGREQACGSRPVLLTQKRQCQHSCGQTRMKSYDSGEFAGPLLVGRCIAAWWAPLLADHATIQPQHRLLWPASWQGLEADAGRAVLNALHHSQGPR